MISCTNTYEDALSEGDHLLIISAFVLGNNVFVVQT